MGFFNGFRNGFQEAKLQKKHKTEINEYLSAISLKDAEIKKLENEVEELLHKNEMLEQTLNHVGVDVDEYIEEINYKNELLDNLKKLNLKNKEVNIDYVDGNFNETNRDIKVVDVDYEKLQLKARCYKVKAKRTFKFERVLTITDLKTGEVIFENRTFEDDPMYKIHKEFS